MPQEALSKKEKNMLKAAQGRWVYDWSNERIAKEIGLTKSTVDNYFSDPEMEQFEKHFSDEQIEFLKVQMQQRIEDGTKLANNLVAKGIQDESAKPSTKIKAAREAQKIPERYIKMMQELGVIQKPKERKEEVSDGGDITFNEEIVTKSSDAEGEESVEA
jgi:DNA-binding transcriptional regulator LsrR (DeoR family)